MNIAVLIKQVPDTYSERTLRSADGILDRAAADPVLDEINERAVEAALQLKEAHGGEVTVVCMGPASAADAIRKALSMGADRAVHLSDDTLAGSDAVQTARALARYSRPCPAWTWSWPATAPPTAASPRCRPWWPTSWTCRR